MYKIMVSVLYYYNHSLQLNDHLNKCNLITLSYVCCFISVTHIRFCFAYHCDTRYVCLSMWPMYFNANVLTDNSEDSSSSVAVIVMGCVVGVVVVCIAIIALAIFLLWYKKKKSKDANIQGNYGSVCKVCKVWVYHSYLFVCACSNILVTESTQSELMYLHKLHMFM